MKTLLLSISLLLVTSCAWDLDGHQYAEWYQTLSPSQQAQEDQRRHERRIAAMQAYGMMNMGRLAAPAYTPPLYTEPRYRAPVGSDPLPSYVPQRSQRCTSNVVGSYIYTNCY
jgi:hypothetical protein